MFERRPWKRRYLAVAGLLAILAASCSGEQPPNESGELSTCTTSNCTNPPNSVIGYAANPNADQGSLEGPLASLPQQLKQTDFRLNPPVVTGVFASAAADGRNTVVRVDFAQDPRLASV